MPTELSPEDPQPVEGDTALPGMPSLDQLAQQIADRVENLRAEIAENVQRRKTLQRDINVARAELAKAERLLKATKPRGVK